MNKTDILARKLEQEIQVKDHIPEFDGNKNDFLSVTECELVLLFGQWDMVN
jgi:hypothetical protein